MKAFISMIAAMKMRQLCLRKKCVLEKVRTRAQDFSSNNEELERIERNIRMVKQEIHHHNMIQALDRLD